MSSFFQLNNQTYILAIVLLSISILLFKYNKTDFSIITLVIGGFILRYTAASADLFLHVWDEQFHALVAQHMIDNPFKPVLQREPIFPYSFKEWTGNYIWLHKQPWFLWQMALSIKFFGATALAARVPSIIMTTLLILVIYRLGKLIASKETGYFAAIIFTFSYFFIEINSGFIATDHNDIAYLFYVSLSVWAYFEYQAKKHFKWLILIGLFSGIAVLNKWLGGLIIFPVWALSSLLQFLIKKNTLEIRPIAFAFLISLVTFIPWQLFIHIKYPIEAAYEMSLNGRHFFEAVEGHEGDYWFHYESILKMYGRLSLFFIVPGIYFILKKSNTNSQFFILIFLISVFTFYSLAETKMTLFIVIITPIIMIAFGSILEQIFNYSKNWNKYLNFTTSFIILLITIHINCNFNKMLEFHTEYTPYEIEYKLNENYHTITKTLNMIDANDKVIFFNCKNFNNIQVMYYTNSIAYSFIPSEADIKKLLSLNYNLIFFNGSNMPKYVTNNNQVKILANELINLYNE